MPNRQGNKKTEIENWNCRTVECPRQYTYCSTDQMLRYVCGAPARMSTHKNIQAFLGLLLLGGHPFHTSFLYTVYRIYAYRYRYYR
jgi:hypothetical protein